MKRGFSLIELGIFIAIASVMVLVVVPGATGLMNWARVQRTSNELNSLLQAGAAAATRSVVNNANTNSIQICGKQLGAATPSIWIDLSSTGWGGAFPVTAANCSAMATMLGAGLAGANPGTNAWLQPIAIQLSTTSVVVATCVPNGTAGGGNWAASAELTDYPLAAPAPCPGACNAGYDCVASFSTILPPEMAPLAYTFLYEYGGNGI